MWKWPSFIEVQENRSSRLTRKSKVVLKITENPNNSTQSTDHTWTLHGSHREWRDTSIVFDGIFKLKNLFYRPNTFLRKNFVCNIPCSLSLSMKESYDEEILFYFYNSCSLIVILKTDYLPTNQTTNQHFSRYNMLATNQPTHQTINQSTNNQTTNKPSILYYNIDNYTRCVMFT